MSTPIAYHKGAERPSMQLWLLDDDGTLIDFSSGYTFALKIGRPGSAAVVTKTSNITGAVGAGVAPTGTPNVEIVWSADELDITPDRYTWQLSCTSSGVQRIFSGPFIIADVVT